MLAAPTQARASIINSPEVNQSAEVLTKLYRFLNQLKYTPLHPQWIANHHHRRKFELLSKHASKGRYVDIGSGSENVAPHLNGGELVTIDYPLTSFAYGAPPNIYSDVQSLPLADASVDGVIFFEVLEHVRRDEVAIAEISRVLKDNGLLFISAPFIYPLHDAPHDYKRFSHYGLPMLMESNDLAVEEIQQHGNSLTTAIQLVNLVILESVKTIAQRSRLLALALSAPAYILCLFGNLVSLPLMMLQKPNALLLGQTLVARKLPRKPG